MSGSSHPLALPPDVRLAFEAATNVIAGLRYYCKDLRRICDSLKNLGRSGTLNGEVRQFFHLIDDVWETDVVHFAQTLRLIVDDMSFRAKVISPRTAPLREELEQVACGHIGKWITPYGAISAAGERIAPDFAKDVSDLCTNRTKPYATAEFLEVAQKYEAVIDELYTEALREAKQLAVLRERNTLVDPQNAVLNGEEWIGPYRVGQWRTVWGISRNAAGTKLHALKMKGLARKLNRMNWEVARSALNRQEQEAAAQL